jgi:hypothetical protein
MALDAADCNQWHAVCDSDGPSAKNVKLINPQKDIWAEL